RVSSSMSCLILHVTLPHTAPRCSFSSPLPCCLPWLRSVEEVLDHRRTLLALEASGPVALLEEWQRWASSPRHARGRLWTLSPASGGPGSCGGPAAARLRSALSRAQLAQARRSAAEQRTSFRRRQLLRCLVGRAEAALAAAAHVARQRAVRRPGLQPAAAAAGRPRPHPTAKRRWASEAATGESSVGAARAKRACRPEARASGA
ncbi:unnamed protein product, partial [Prorocentrum cordatum]